MSAGAQDRLDEGVSPRPSAPERPQAPPATAIRAAPPRPRQLSRKALMAGALGLSAIVAFALMSGLSERERTHAPSERPTPMQPASPPESVRIAQADYSADDLRPPLPAEAGDYFWGPHRDGNAEAELDTRGDAPRSAPADPAAPLAEQAYMSAIRFDGAGLGSGSPVSAAARPSDDEGALDADYRPPRSPFAIHAGSTISAALITALNSDRPGRVIAQVTEDVYDSVRGEHLLIPQGARLLGTYDAATAHGDQRLLIGWDRLIMPDGWTIALHAMPGADAQGASGVRDRVDAQLGRIAVASLLSGVLSVAANAVEDDGAQRIGESIGDAAAQEAARVGGRIIDRELNVRPTLRVRAGAPVRVLVSETIHLRPYQR